MKGKREVVGSSLHDAMDPSELLRGKCSQTDSHESQHVGLFHQYLKEGKAALQRVTGGGRL